MFHLNPSSGVPIYRQLVDQIRRLIAAGQLRPGDSLPSVRELAQAHAINPMTISKAYSLLEHEGLLLRQRGKPMRVAGRGASPPSDVQGALHEPLAQLVAAGRQLTLTDAEIQEALANFLQRERRR
ncbi:GntR family transcriptional regulator [Marinimicrobium sp. ABcell2]|uniref:GntR family transcriptional regulator n=1 Tax=Marinimicrobium sp. ABcell2 TaxID=3069751 RepID=UPI0027B863EF|nr:GntR family transcriptional regulator [Marinimicrobium sp. ABcell2]MDQ2076024.1 GntR family transcriptional regulator [Marinimicrobium sp. ABcell2]